MHFQRWDTCKSHCGISDKQSWWDNKEEAQENGCEKSLD